MKQIRWAIVGTGYIAKRFAQGMEQVKDAVLAAVVSRKQESGEKFARVYSGERIFTDYEEMLRTVHPDVVYLGIPNDCHYEYIRKALEHQVHVLCEKPIVDAVWQLDEVYRMAEEKNLLLVEGMWTRCFPAVRKVREWIAAGRIGEPMAVNVCFDFKADMETWESWKAGIAHAGGALRDVGIYSLALANMVFPETPEQIYSVIHSNGEVDDNCKMLLDYGKGRSAFASGAFNQNSDPAARISGSEGEISFGPEFWHPYEATLKTSDGTMEFFSLPYKATGFQYEIAAVQEALREGKTELSDFTHEESRIIAQMIEKTRKKWGIIYQADRED